LAEPTELEKAQARLKNELEKWDVLGVDIGTVQTQGGMVRLSQRIDALIHVLLEKGIFVEEDIDMAFCVKSVESLEEIRKEIGPAVAQARLDAIKNGRRIQ
jgi:hypothetical protein